MPQRNITFQTSDNVTLRGWLFTPPESASTRLPCLVMSHGWSALKEMDLDAFANYFISKLPLACLVYDNRGFGDSDHAQGQPRQEIVPSVQRSDISDAITYAQSLPEVEPTRIGIWGSSYSGGHVLQVGAVDRRVKAVVSQAWVLPVALTDGWQNFHRLIRSDVVPQMNAMFEQGKLTLMYVSDWVIELTKTDRIARAAGEKAATIPVVAKDSSTPSALPTADSYKFFSEWEAKSAWKNEVTVRSVELLRGNDPSHMVHRISPTPLLMVVADNDVLCPTDITLETYWKARKPKELQMLPGGHFDAYTGPLFKQNADGQVEFLRKTLCAE